MGRHVDRFLAGGGVEHQQNLLRLDQVAKADQFLHERFVNLQTAGGVEDERVAVVGPGKVEGCAGDLQNVRFAPLEENGQLEFLTERFELVHRRRAVNVRRHQQRRAALFLQQPGEFAAGSGFAGTVQANEQRASRTAAQVERRVLRAQQSDQLVVDDFDDLLARLNALNDLLADRLFLDSLDEIAGDLEIDIGVQQRHPDLAQRISHVGLGNLSQSAQVPENVLELAAQRIEHAPNVSTPFHKYNHVCATAEASGAHALQGVRRARLYFRRNLSCAPGRRAKIVLASRPG